MNYKHSTPWRVVKEEGLPLIVSKTQPGYIAQCYDDEGNAQQNAAFIVEAVNQHREYEDFVNKLERLAQQYPDQIDAEWLLRKIDTLKAILAW